MDNDFNQLTDFTNIGLNRYMMPLNSPITAPSALPGIMFDMQNEIQGRLARLSNINVKNFIFQTTAGSTSFSLNNGQSTGILVSTANNPPHQREPMWAQQYITIYQGTAAVGSLEIFPFLGASINGANYNVGGGFDYDAYSRGTTANFGIKFTNNSGSTETYSLYSQTKYIQYNASTAG